MKRFYKAVTVARLGENYQVNLDNRPIKTALGNPQVVPSLPLGNTLAAEWDAQSEEMDPALFQLRDLADFTIDMVSTDRAGIIAKLLTYLETDTLCYRANPDEPFFARQEQVWEPLVTQFETSEAITLTRVCGIMHQPQPERTREMLRSRLDQFSDFELTALLTMTSLAASLVIGLSAMAEDTDADPLWAAANLEEDWQIEQWGHDSEAQAIRARRTQDFHNAVKFLRLART